MSLEVQGTLTETRANRTQEIAVMTSKLFDRARIAGQKLASFDHWMDPQVQVVTRTRE